MEPNEVLCFKCLKLDCGGRKLFINGDKVVLRNKEFSLLEYFMNNVGRVLSRTQILEDVWDHNICCPTNTVDVHVSSLRKKLESFSSGYLIRTVHCIGYIFEG